ncbi:MAG: type I-E CRISPR-associated protein Cas6/Cse3/CasE [Clostridia bacterium]|nr:type I-E CRISPR-associated protein Cas6/Cse3/CasE [Clostridia bacterium]
MYLTRMRLDLTNRRTMQAMTSPNLFHGAIESAFGGERKRNLWRMDTLRGQAYLMILSRDIPELSAVCAQFSAPGERWETRDYAPLLDRIEAGGRWHFRLVANPTRCCVEEHDSEMRRGTVRAHVTAQKQREWLMERAQKHGFSLKEGEYEVTHSQWHHFRKGTDGGRRVSLLAVAYEGSLTVTDEALFRLALTEGIGRGKAYGMGMLTIVRQVRP